MLQVGDSIKIKFSRFKRKYEYSFGEHGIVLEKIGGGICLYVTDASHDDIHCVIPLGYDKDFKDANYYLYYTDTDKMMFRVRNAVLYVDYAGKFCSTNVENFRVFGSEEWGQNCLLPWKDEYTREYNRAERRKNGTSNGN